MLKYICLAALFFTLWFLGENVIAAAGLTCIVWAIFAAFGKVFKDADATRRY